MVVTETQLCITAPQIVGYLSITALPIVRSSFHIHSSAFIKSRLCMCHGVHLEPCDWLAHREVGTAPTWEAKMVLRNCLASEMYTRSK